MSADAPAGGRPSNSPGPREKLEGEKDGTFGRILGLPLGPLRLPVMYNMLTKPHD